MQNYEYLSKMFSQYLDALEQNCIGFGRVVSDQRIGAREVLEGETLKHRLAILDQFSRVLNDIENLVGRDVVFQTGKLSELFGKLKEASDNDKDVDKILSGISKVVGSVRDSKKEDLDKKLKWLKSNLRQLGDPSALIIDKYENNETVQVSLISELSQLGLNANSAIYYSMQRISSENSGEFQLPEREAEIMRILNARAKIPNDREAKKLEKLLPKIEDIIENRARAREVMSIIPGIIRELKEQARRPAGIGLKTIEETERKLAAIQKRYESIFRKADAQYQDFEIEEMAEVANHTVEAYNRQIAAESYNKAKEKEAAEVAQYEAEKAKVDEEILNGIYSELVVLYDQFKTLPAPKKYSAELNNGGFEAFWYQKKKTPLPSSASKLVKQWEEQEEKMRKIQQEGNSQPNA